MLPLADAIHHLADGLWEQDPLLQALLTSIVAEAAEIGGGARLVVTSTLGQPRVLIGVRGNYRPWRSLAQAALEHGEIRSVQGAIAVPMQDRCAVLLLYGDPDRGSADMEPIARSYAGCVEMALAASTARLATVQGATDALLRALMAHDEPTARHSINVRHLTHALARAMDVGGHTLLEWEWVALLHDVGKIAVPATLLNKAHPLDCAEWAIIRQHPGIGERIVGAIPTLGAVALAVRHHHERWDGAGYPDRLDGEAIPMAARVVALVDAYETMRTGRPYRPPLTHAEAVLELRHNVGRQFDPGLAQILSILTDHDLLPATPP